MAQNTGLRFKVIFLGRNPPQDERADRLLYWGKRFHQIGIASGTTGNLSFRTGEGFVITGTGSSLATLEKEQLAEVVQVETGESRILVYARGKVPPSKESLFHAGIYQLRAEINAVFHVHDYLVLEAAAELGIPATGREQPRGSPELANDVRQLLGSRKRVTYFILKNHGVVSMGGTTEEAGELAERIHEAAQKWRRSGGNDEDDAGAG